MITPIYILSLIVFTTITATTFFGYQKLIGARYLPPLDSIVGGFIIFLAINQLIALPFIIFHLSFKLFYIIFLLVNLPGFFYGLYRAWKIRSKLQDKPKPSVLGVIAVLIVAIGMVATQIYVKYSSDDAYYVSLIQQNMDSSQLYSIEPATGNPEIIIPAHHHFESWELIQASFAKTFNLSGLEMAHSLMPLLIVPLAFLAHRQVFRLFFKSGNSINMATLLLGTMFMFGGYSLYSHGTLLLTKPWHGKAILATVIIPFLFFLLIKIKQSPHKNKIYLPLFVLCLAAAGLNSTAIFVIGGGVFAFIVLLAITKKLDYKNFLKVALSVSPLVLNGLAILFINSQQDVSIGSTDNTRSGLDSWLEIVNRVAGSSWYFYLLLVALAIMVVSKYKSIRDNTKFFVIFLIIIFVFYLNPVVFGPISNFTSSSYWRFYWLIPLTIMLPVAAVYLINRYTRQKGIFRKYIQPLAIVLAIIVLVLGGSWVFNFKNPNVAKDLTKEKIPLEVADVLHFMKTQPEGNTVATAKVATYYNTVPNDQTLFISRLIYYKRYCADHNNQRCSDYLKLWRAANGTQIISENEIARLFEKYSVDYFIANNSRASLYEPNYPRLLKNKKFSVFKIQQ